MLDVCVAWSPGPRQVEERTLRLPAGSRVADALRASGVGSRLPAQALDAMEVAVWGRKAALDQPLRSRDRVELLRELRVDPKVARRERFSRQGARAAGLFAKKPKKA
ncbi:RnfH family protein [Ramlibacter sp.]|uniref:UPF0125 protein IM725_11530 n=2 Tax=Ramlibacter aquaticus TaxID=2780094 RepID=A0ABR9SFS7_9BURK|nr:RnfH family protein [Ramlibacter sp.]MBE7941201.1 RnfH family protein [Ramlibacter aquaticus]